MITEFAPAKINLALHVTGQRADGYHLLDTLVTFADVGDRLSFENASELSLHITGPEGKQLTPDADILILRAAQGLKSWADKNNQDTAGAQMVLEKNLPISSGIGGGSADAAAALRGLITLWQLDIPEIELMVLALKLGADVPMCLNGKPLHAQGIGEDISPVSMPEFSMVLVNPRVSVSTPEVYSALPDTENPPLAPVPANVSHEPVLAWIKDQRNDLQTPAMSLAPEITHCLEVLRNQGAQLKRMSGSGATCFGIFETPERAQRSADKISAGQPDWWVAPCSTVC